MEKQGINKYIDIIFDTIKASDDLMKLIYYNDKDWVSKPLLTKEQKDSLIYNKIYPFRFVPKISTEACTYLNMAFGRFKRSGNPQFHVGKVTFFISCHTSLWQTYYGLRPVSIFEEIINIFENTQIGLRELKMIDSDEYWVNNDFGGYYITFELYDFIKGVN